MTATARTRELLALLQAPGIGPARALRTLNHEKNGAGPGPGLGLTSLPEGVQRAAKQRADEIVAASDDLDIALVGIEDEVYPPLLRMISDPPPILYVRGKVDVLSRRALAVVGTRKASLSGRSVARSIGRILATNGTAVVSGLAIGIDTEAHLGALDGRGVTIGVLAHGLDTISPPRNRELASRILDRGGALVSEHPPGTPAFRSEFVRRNRIQSGLSLGSIVVESEIEGGAIHQARFTIKQRRRLFVVMSGPGDESSSLQTAGASYLATTYEATVLRGVDDLERELAGLVPPSAGPVGHREGPGQTSLDV